MSDTRIKTRYEGHFRIFLCECGLTQAVNATMPWCSQCFTEYSVGAKSVTLRPGRRTERYAWAKAIGRAGGAKIG